jgi:hypothetical protein
MICSLVSGPVPDLSIYYVDVEHNDEMASIAVKEVQPLSVLKMLIVQTMHSRSFCGKMKKAYCSQCTGVFGFLFLFFSPTGDVVSAMMRCD